MSVSTPFNGKWARKLPGSSSHQNRFLSPCPAGNRHDHRASGVYVPRSFHVDVTQVVQDNLVVGGSWSDSQNRVRFDVPAMGVNSGFSL